MTTEMQDAMKAAFAEAIAPLQETIESQKTLIDAQAKAMGDQEAAIAEMKANFEAGKKKSNIKSIFLNGEEKEVDGLTKEEKSFAFLKAVVQNNTTTIKTLSEGVNEDGGYTVPRELAAELLQIQNEEAVFVNEVQTVEMASRSLDITELVKTGVGLTWENELATATATGPTFGRVVLTAYKVRAEVGISTELIEDSNQSIINVLKTMLGEALATETDNVICQGTGTSQPEGVFVNAAVEAAKESGAAITYDTLVAQVYALSASKRKGGIWAINRADMQAVEMLKDGNNRPLVRDLLGDASARAILGYPVRESDSVPAGQVIFGNFKKGYWLGLRTAISVEVDKDYKNDKQVIYLRRRIAGKTVLPSMFSKFEVN